MDKTNDPEKMGIDLTDLANTLAGMRQNAVGFEENDDQLSGERKKALEYFKGEMRDVPAFLGRSTAIDTTCADTIETVLPDLLEIFTDEDVVSFDPVGDEDVDAARQETDFIQHVIFSENRGWLNLYTAFKDALITKTGVFKWWGETETESDEQTIVAANEFEAVALLEQLPEDAEIEEREDGSVAFSFVTEKKNFKVCFKAVASNNFATSADGASVKECTYCVMRSRERVQTLIADGYNKDRVLELATYIPDEDGELSRDTVFESQEDGVDVNPMLREVELLEHYIYTDLDGKGLKHWKILTGGDESHILDIEEVSEKPFSTITPFIVPFRMIGQSMVDKTMQIQAIKTVLLRFMMDEGTFSINARQEVSEADSNDFTINDLMNNTPGRPVRSRTGKAVRPIQSGSPSFDVLNAIEQISVMSEQRTGVIRNNQGLNSDALHDTATGQQSMMNMGQRRTRMIARSFAETGFRDLCLGIHNILRQSALGPMRARMSGKSVDVDPTSWGVRKDMTINIGGGGKDEARMAMRELLELLKEIAEMQGGLNGPVVDLKGVYKVMEKYTDIMPIKGINGIFMSPDEQPPQGEEGPSPEEMQAQAEMQAKQAELQMKQADMQATQQAKIQEQQINAQIKQMELEAKREASALDAQLKRDEAQARLEVIANDAAQKQRLAETKAAFEMNAQTTRANFEMQMAERQFALQERNAERQAANVDVNVTKLRPGGRADA